MKAFGTACNAGTQKVSFKRVSQENDPVARVEKKLRYFTGAEKKDLGSTERCVRDIRTAIQEIRKLAEKRHGPELSRLYSEADRPTEALRGALQGLRMHDHAPLPDPYTCSSSGETPCLRFRMPT